MSNIGTNVLPNTAFTTLSEVGDIITEVAVLFIPNEIYISDAIRFGDILPVTRGTKNEEKVKILSLLQNVACSLFYIGLRSCSNSNVAIEKLSVGHRIWYFKTPNEITNKKKSKDDENMDLGEILLKYLDKIDKTEASNLGLKKSKESTFSIRDSPEYLRLRTMDYVTISNFKIGFDLHTTNESSWTDFDNPLHPCNVFSVESSMVEAKKYGATNEECNLSNYILEDSTFGLSLKFEDVSKVYRVTKDVIAPWRFGSYIKPWVIKTSTYKELPSELGASSIAKLSRKNIPKSEMKEGEMVNKADDIMQVDVIENIKDPSHFIQELENACSNDLNNIVNPLSIDVNTIQTNIVPEDLEDLQMYSSKFLDAKYKELFKLDSENENDPQINLIEKEIKAFKSHLLVLFKRLWNLRKMHPAANSVEEWVRDYLSKNKNLSTKERFVHDSKDLSLFNQLIMDKLLMVAENGYYINNNHHVYVLLRFISFCSSYHERILKPNILMTGKAASGKSFFEQVTSWGMIPGTFKFISYATEKASTAGPNEDDIVKFYEEMPLSLLGINYGASKNNMGRSDGSKSDEEGRFKNILTSGLNITESCDFKSNADGSRDRILVKTVKKCSGSHIGATNTAADELSDSIVSRMIPMAVPHVKRYSRPNSSIIGLPKLESTRTQDIINDQRCEHALVYICQKMIQCGILNKVDMGSHRSLTRKYLKYLGKQGIDVKDARKISRMEQIARVIAIWRAIYIVFNMDDEMRNKKFEFEDMLKLDDYLYVDEDITMFVWGLSSKEYFNDIELDVIKVLLKRRNVVDDELNVKPTAKLFKDKYFVINMSMGTVANPFNDMCKEIKLGLKHGYSDQDIKSVFQDLFDKTILHVTNQNEIERHKSIGSEPPKPKTEKIVCARIEGDYILIAKQILEGFGKNNPIEMAIASTLSEFTKPRKTLIGIFKNKEKPYLPMSVNITPKSNVLDIYASDFSSLFYSDCEDHVQIKQEYDMKKYLISNRKMMLRREIRDLPKSTFTSNLSFEMKYNMSNRSVNVNRLKRIINNRIERCYKPY